MMDLLIRQATEKDFMGLNALYDEIDEHHRKELPHIFKKPEGPARTRDFLSGVLADPSAVIYIAEVSSQIIGLVHAYVRVLPEIPIRISCRAGEVDSLIVKKEYRRHGVGIALMERVHKWADEMKLDRLELSVWDFNTGAQTFYQELKFKPAFHRLWRYLEIS